MNNFYQFNFDQYPKNLPQDVDNSVYQHNM